MFEPKKLQGIFSPAAVMLALAIIFFFGNSVRFLHAQPAADDPQPEPTPVEENVICQKEMEIFLDAELKTFNKWVRGHFQNKSSTSSLLSDAFGRYEQLRLSAYAEYSRYFAHQGAFQLTESLEPSACLQQLESTLAEARRTLEHEAKATSTVKKATILLNKYKEINAQLRLLNQNFLTMKKYLDTFADKLPCYINKSCNKG